MIDERLVLGTPAASPGPRRDYVKSAAWLLAFLFGSALIALAVLLVIWVT